MVSYKVYHRMNWSSVTQGLFWDQESRINSVRTMKKKAKTIDRSIQNLHMFLCKMTTLLRVTFQACKSSTVPRQHYILKSSSYCLNIQPHSSLQNSSKKTATPEKKPQKYNQSWKTSVFRRHYWVLVPLKSIKYRKFDQNWSNKQQIVARVVPFFGWSHHRPTTTNGNACWPFFCRPLPDPIRPIKQSQPRQCNKARAKVRPFMS